MVITQVDTSDDNIGPILSLDVSTCVPILLA